MSVVDDLINRFGTAQAIALLNSQITSAQAVAAGITPPYPSFTNATCRRIASVAQALRPFPQYQTINLTASGGDKTGTSMYHAGIFKVTQRMNDGLTFQGSYVFSKLMTDADSFAGSTGAMDTAQPELEYSIGPLDQTHIIKLSTVYELPFGESRRWLTSAASPARSSAAGALPRCRTTPAARRSASPRNAPLPIFNGTNRPNVTGEDWRAPIAGDEFDPLVDRFLNRDAFATPVGTLGNAPRRNEDVRRFWNLSENISLAKTVDDLEQDAARRAGGSLQSLQPHRLGRARTEFHQRQFRADYDSGQLAAADAVRREVVLVGSAT